MNSTRQCVSENPIPICKRGDMMKNHITQLCLGILCVWTMCSIIGCAPPPSDPLVMHVASSDGVAYAALGPGKVPFPLAAPYAQSEDGGKTWKPATSVSQGIFQEKTQPFVLCDPNRESLCFRITQKSQVDESKFRQDERILC